MGQLTYGGAINNSVICIYCHQKICCTHKIVWHNRLTCEEYDSKMQHDLKATLIWLNKNTKSCTSCSYQIENSDGCDHMTFIKCQYEF